MPIELTCDIVYNQLHMHNTWKMDLKRLEDMVGRSASDMRIENSHVVCVFPGHTTAVDGGGTTVGADVIVRFRKW